MKRFFSKIIQLAFYWPFKWLFIVFLHFKTKGEHNIKKANTSFILAVNHISYLDPMIILTAVPFRFRYFPFHFMMWDFLYNIFFFLRFMGAIPSRKGKGLEISTAPFIKKLTQGERIIIFPEGAIKRKGRPINARRGISYIAAKTGKYILPAKIDSDLKGWINIIGDSIINLLKRKHRALVIFGEPFKIEETIGKTPVTDNELRQASEEVMKRVRALK